MKTNKIIGQDRIGPYKILYTDPKIDNGILGKITCRKIILKGVEYDVVPSNGVKYMIAIESQSNENVVGETIEYY